MHGAVSSGKLTVFRLIASLSAVRDAAGARIRVSVKDYRKVLYVLHLAAVMAIWVAATPVAIILVAIIWSV